MSNTQSPQPGNLGNKIIEKNKNGNNTNGNIANGNNTNGNNANGNNASGNNTNGNNANNLEGILKNNNAETKNVALSGKDADAMIAQQNKINANKTNANKTNANKVNTKKNNKVNTNKLNNKPQNQSLTMKAPDTNQEENIPTADNQDNQNNNNTGETGNAIENTDLEQNVVKAETTNNKDKNTMINLNKLTMNLLNHQIVLKLFHFQTELYGAHKASDGYLEKFAQTMDKFLEIAQGIYGKITLKKYTLTGSSHTDENIIKHIDGMITLLREKIDDVLGEYTDLINIRDELVGDVEQLKYLLSFK